MKYSELLVLSTVAVGIGLVYCGDTYFRGKDFFVGSFKRIKEKRIAAEIELIAGGAAIVETWDECAKSCMTTAECVSFNWIGTYCQKSSLHPDNATSIEQKDDSEIWYLPRSESVVL